MTLARLLGAEGTECEEEHRDAGGGDADAGDENANDDGLEVRFHGRDGTTMKRPDSFPPLVVAAIFDFDETMIDLEAQHGATYAALCRELGADYGELPESFRLRSGFRVIDDLAEMRAFFGWRETGDELMALRQRHFDDALRDAADLALLPGVEHVVRALHEKGIPLAIASSAVGSSIDAILRRFRLRHCFDVIVDGSQVLNGKPDPEAYLVTARRLRTDASACVVFEDSHVGVLAAKAAKMYCIAIRNPHAHIRQDLGAADLVLHSFEEFDPEWIRAASPTAR